MSCYLWRLVCTSTDSFIWERKSWIQSGYRLKGDEMATREPTVVDVLKRIKSILTRRGWVQGYYAKTKRGKIVGFNSKAAVGYCLTGARLLAGKELRRDTADAKRLIESCVPKPFTVEMFNDADSTTKKDVVEVVNCAIKKATNSERTVSGATP